ncbi:hypothetical protein BJ875DRAFT_489939 [Amylocarpus encephaloides]|uniref:Granulins domain-containing protein n=1 Tax=Amylocarpus encephaloides TaxID=45428 RepID=A0A9P7Y760_9HELO|nr:hypothetical protein BJ875DRAFT_489939 [Amylocarpus encephaloides]
MRFSTIVLFLLASVVAAEPTYPDARSGPAPVSGVLAAKDMLFKRQAYDLCYDGTYCINEYCCGYYNCMPIGGECCSNGQYCLAGESCVIQSGFMRCKNTAGVFVQPASITATASAAPVGGSSVGGPTAPATPQPNAGGRESVRWALVGVVGVAGLALWL